MQLHPVSQKIQKQIQGLSSDNQTRLAGKSFIYGGLFHPNVPFLGDFHGFPIATFGFPGWQLQFLHKTIIQMIQDHPRSSKIIQVSGRFVPPSFHYSWFVCVAWGLVTPRTPTVATATARPPTPRSPRPKPAPFCVCGAAWDCHPRLPLR